MSEFNSTIGFYSQVMYCNLNNHYFVFAGRNPDGEIPEGFPCSCKMFKAHYETCPTCGNKHMVLVENK